jgi:hypothetical protein
LTTTGDLSACKSKRTLIQLLTVNKVADDVVAIVAMSGFGRR